MKRACFVNDQILALGSVLILASLQGPPLSVCQWRACHQRRRYHHLSTTPQTPAVVLTVNPAILSPVPRFHTVPFLLYRSLKKQQPQCPETRIAPFAWKPWFDPNRSFVCLVNVDTISVAGVWRPLFDHPKTIMLWRVTVPDR